MEIITSKVSRQSSAVCAASIRGQPSLCDGARYAVLSMLRCLCASVEGHSFFISKLWDSQPYHHTPRRSREQAPWRRHTHLTHTHAQTHSSISRSHKQSHVSDVILLLKKPHVYSRLSNRYTTCAQMCVCEYLWTQCPLIHNKSSLEKHWTAAQYTVEAALCLFKEIFNI